MTVYGCMSIRINEIAPGHVGWIGLSNLCLLRTSCGGANNLLEGWALGEGLGLPWVVQLKTW